MGRENSFPICHSNCAGERVGLIGPNGAGKSTLLRLLAGREEADAGDRSLRRGIRLGYVPQDDVFPAGQTVREVVLGALTEEHVEEHESATQASIALTRTGFSDPDQMADVLSGGWRKRLALARELARRPDLLLLDEPTNHLDLPGIIWLERLLRAAPFGYVVITHDRAFLRAVADEIIEINRAYPAGFFRAPGTYEEFANCREQFLEAQARRQEAVANQVRRDTEWLGRKESAQRSKSSARIEEAARQRGELAELKARNAAGGAAGIDFVATGRQTRKLLTATGLAKSLGGRPLFADLDVALTPGIKLALFGANGSGKSTLLRVLSGDIAADAGTITRAEGLRVVMFEQGRAGLDLTATLRKALCPNGDMVIYRDRPAPRRGLGETIPLSARAIGPVSRRSIRRRTSARPHCPTHAQTRRPVAARRTDQRSGYSGDGSAGRKPGRIPWRPGARQSRSRFDGPIMHRGGRTRRPRQQCDLWQRRPVAFSL